MRSSDNQSQTTREAERADIGSKGWSYEKRKEKLAYAIRGWVNYFRLAEMDSEESRPYRGFIVRDGGSGGGAFRSI